MARRMGRPPASSCSSTFRIARAERIFLEQGHLDILPLREQIFSRFQMYLASFGEI